uniref:Zinc knuckle CX2CX4HX4C domain-containing protein n=1 Tax=Quercus lobata TaxID=97700 RepID=A0A7N2LT92_QUELO
MEQAVIEELQNLYLTKEEEEEIQISVQSRDDLLEECSLSLFGRLLSERQQNLWGLPFELMSEEVGQDIGRSLGCLIEVDKRACQLDQAKFMRIRVDAPIDKPLRRGGNVVSKDGEKFWIHFKYERLPTFCFLCGMLGHDDKHCQTSANQQGTPKQYGDWLRAHGNFKGGNPSFKGGNARQRTFSSNNQNTETENRANEEDAAAMGRSSVSPACHMEENRESESFQN